jgi:hypothetical protein
VTFFPSGPDTIATFEVFADNPDASENERLNAYTIAVEGPAFSETGARFIVPPVDAGSGTIPFDLPTFHPYVFGAYPGNGPVDPANLSDFNTVLLAAALGGTGQEANISDAASGFAKLSVLIPSRDLGGIYPIILDTPLLSLGSAGLPITTVGENGAIVRPEPGSLGLLAAAGLLALRRRRGA